MVKISVIMPVYNEEQYLKKSIQSVLNQTLKNIELIIVDDGSEDDSLKIIKGFAKKYKNIRIFTQKNQGSGKARNKAIKEAKGEYIGFLDADDFFIDTDALEKLYNHAKYNNADMVSGNIKLVDQNDELLPFKDLPYFYDYGEILPEHYGMPWAFYKNIYKKEFLVKNRIYFPDLLRGQDPVFLAEILSLIDKIFVVPTDVYAYLYINGAKQCNTYKKRHDHIMHYKMVFEYLKNPKFSEVVHRFRHEFIGFIDMMGFEGAIDTIKSIQDIFSDDPKSLRDCEEYFYFKYKDYPKLSKFVNYTINPDKPRVSVVIPVYNVEEFLDEAITSLLNQSFDDFELICVNDGSKDNSLKILNKYASIDARVKVVDKKNGGCGSARNRALDEARGEYIYFFDPDDYVLPNTLEELYKNAISNDSDLVMFKIARFIEGEPIDYSMPFYEFDKIFTGTNFNHFTFSYKQIKHYVLNSAFAPWSKLYKKAFLDEYDDFRFDLNVAFDDVPFHVKTILRAKKISFSPQYYYHYRYTNPNSVNNTASNAVDIMKIVDLVEDFLLKEGYMEEFKDEFNMFKINQTNMYLVSSNSEEYFKQAKKKLSDISFDEIKHVPVPLLKKYDLILNSNSLKEFIVANKSYDVQSYNYYLNYDNNVQSTINDGLRNEYQSKNSKKTKLINSYDSFKIKCDKLKQKNKKVEQANDKMNNIVSTKYNEIIELEEENKRLNEQARQLEEHKNKILSSTSWKITKPLRGLKHVFK